MIKDLNLHIRPSRFVDGDLELAIELVVNEKKYNCVELIYESDVVSRFDVVFDRAREIIKNAIKKENPVEKKLIAGVNSTIKGPRKGG